MSCCSQGSLLVWEKTDAKASVPEYRVKSRKNHDNVSLTVADGIKISDDLLIIGCVTTDSRVLIYSLRKGKCSFSPKPNIVFTNKVVFFNFVSE